MNKLLRWVYRYWDRINTGVYLALVNSGSWYVEYPNGDLSRGLQYSDAKTLAKLYHAKLKHFNQLPNTTIKGKYIHEQD